MPAITVIRTQVRGWGTAPDLGATHWPPEPQHDGYYSNMCSSRCWDESFPRTPSYLEVVPPQAVTINLDQALARDNPSLRTSNPLRVTAGGLKLTGYCPGHLHAWIQLNTGTWMGCCTFTAHSGNQRGQLDLRQWLPASAITPRTDQDP
jgi:hypothetical protein